MIPSPILKVLSSIRTHDVKALLMGGQACVLYGAAEFSRDTDFAILAEPANLARLQSALDELRAECIAVPPFESRYLERGHAVHFRCGHPDALGLRIDVLSIMRGVEPFEALWARRTTLTDDRGVSIELMALPDLVQAKKTQRDKDWPMIRRLLEAHYFQNREGPTEEMLRFWLMELRTPELLFEIATVSDALRAELAARRGLLRLLPGASVRELEAALEDEMREEREKDREYWQPLRAELEKLRHRIRRDRGDSG